MDRIVTEECFEEVLCLLKEEQTLYLDTETTGLRPYHGDILFSIIIGTEGGSDFYFNFNEYPEVKPLSNERLKQMQELFDVPTIHWFFHNAKYDMHILAQDGLEIKGHVHDIQTLDRLQNNQHFTYSLDVMSKRLLGLKKSPVVDDYVKANKLEEKVDYPECNKVVKLKHFELVPFDVITKYGFQDVFLTRKCKEKLATDLSNMDASGALNWPKVSQVVENESKLQKTVYKMEKVGAKINRKYCEEATNYYADRVQGSMKEFEALTGEKFLKSGKLFSKLFADEKDKWQYTEKRNPQFTADILKNFENPAAKCVVEYSESKKSLEYFQGFLFHADKNDVIHTDLKPHGTKTGRFSSSDPNLQNLTKPDKYDTEGTKDDSPYPVRRAFVPREGYFLAMLDYDQMEYRLFLDLCRAHGLIEKVKAGLDVHEATAEIGGVSRTEAKMCNFATLYGSGVKNLSEKLGCSEAHARKVRDSIFHSAPEIPEFIRRVIDMAEKRGYIFNWFGRRYQFPDRDWSYRAPNYLIQGGTADVNKIALNRLSDFLEGMRSRLILTIHDEAVFEIHEEEALLIPRLKEIMETVYPYKYLPLTCSVEYSFKSLADKTEGYPLASSYGEKAGNNIQGEGTREARSAP